MDSLRRIDKALERAIRGNERCPPRLRDALHYALFPGGARIRPRLTLAVAEACGARQRYLVDAAAAAIEMMHCASLIQDDLPCFDDAPTRRGKPSVHAVHGERLAILASDALIVAAFDTLAALPRIKLPTLVALQGILGQGVGLRGGITAGQAWECETDIDLEEYHRAKTGALFAAATMAGAAAAGVPHAPWSLTGEMLGRAYQVADDLRDAVAAAADLGKPVGRDADLGRPSAVRERGVQQSAARLKELVGAALAAIPPCPGAEGFAAVVRSEACRLVPKEVAQSAA
jgi:geranylgeranyl diphosphate synthase, type II